jgi:hypothetical protein
VLWARLKNLWNACPKWQAETLPWHAALTAVSRIYLFIYSARPAPLYCEMYTHTHSWLRREWMWITVAKKWYCEWNIFSQTGSDAKCWLDIYHYGAGLAVTGRIRDIGHSVLQSSCSTEVVAAPLNSTFSSLSHSSSGVRGGAVGWGIVLQAWRLRVRFPMMSLEFFIDKILPAAVRSWGWLRL